MKIADRTKLVTWFNDLMTSLNAAPSTHFGEGFQLNTPMGIMHLWLYEGHDGTDSQDLFGRFETPSMASSLGQDVNPWSGKYNCHPGDKQPLDVIQAAFVHHIARVLPEARAAASGKQLSLILEAPGEPGNSLPLPAEGARSLAAEAPLSRSL